MQIPVNSFRLRALPGFLEEIKLPQCLALGLYGDSFVPAGSVDGNMSQPFLNHGEIDAGQQQVTGRSASPDMNRMNPLVRQSRRIGERRSQVLFAERVKTGPCQRAAALVDE